MLAFNSSIQRTGVTWVGQPAEEIGLLVALPDDNVRDLHLCAVLKFLCDLLLATPSDQVMTEILFEQMCNLEEVLKIGSTFEEEKKRQEFYEHRWKEQTVLVTATDVDAVSVADVTDCDFGCG